MAAEAGINIKVNDDGTVKLKKLEGQATSTFDKLKKKASEFKSTYSKTYKELEKGNKGVASSADAFSRLKDAIRSPQGAIEGIKASLPGIGEKLGGVGGKAGIFSKAMNMGKSAMSAFAAAGPVLQAAIIGVTGALIALTAAAMKWAKAALQVGMQNEIFMSQYKTLYGSLDAAEEKFKMVRKVTASTPFQLDEMVALNAQLKTTTNGLLDNAEGLQMMADAAAITGVPFEELGRNVGRAFSGLQYGAAIGEEIANLFDKGLISPNARKQLKLFSEKGIGDSTKMIALLKGELMRFEGGASQMALTLKGVTSNIGDMNRELLSQTGDEMVKPVMYLKKTWLDFITTIQQTGVFKVVGVVFSGVVNVMNIALSLILDPIKILLNAIVSLVGRIKSLIAPINGLTGGAGKLSKIWGTWLKSVLTLKPVLFILKTVFWAIGQAIEFTQKTTFKVIGAFGKWVTSFKPIKAFLTWLDGILGKIAGVATKVAAAIDKFGTKIGAGTLFGTQDQGKGVDKNIDFSGIQDKTKELIKSLKEMTDKEKIIAKYQKQRKGIREDIDAARVKAKGDPISSAKLDIEYKKRLLALTSAQNKELEELEKKKHKKEKDSLEKRLAALRQAYNDVKSLYGELNPADERQKIIDQQNEWIKEITLLNKKNGEAIQRFFGTFEKGVKQIELQTAISLKALEGRTKQLAAKAQSEREAANIARTEQEAQRTKGYASTIESALKENLEKSLKAGILSEEEYSKAKKE